MTSEQFTRLNNNIVVLNRNLARLYGRAGWCSIWLFLILVVLVMK